MTSTLVSVLLTPFLNILERCCSHQELPFFGWRSWYVAGQTKSCHKPQTAFFSMPFSDSLSWYHVISRCSPRVSMIFGRLWPCHWFTIVSHLDHWNPRFSCHRLHMSVVLTPLSLFSLLFVFNFIWFERQQWISSFNKITTHEKYIVANEKWAKPTP